MRPVGQREAVLLGFKKNLYLHSTQGFTKFNIRSNVQCTVEDDEQFMLDSRLNLNRAKFWSPKVLEST